LDIFEQTPSINELVEKLVKKEVLIFRQYQLNVKMSSLMVGKNETMFPTVGFLAH
jgi:hypothetical protein